MGRIAEFQRSFAHDAWADGQYQATLNGLPLTHEVQSAWSHIILSKQLWLARVVGDDLTRLTLWTILSVEDTAVLLPELNRRWKLFLAELKDAELDRVISFINTTGATQQDRLADVLTHVTTHSAHHRGRLSTLLREHGIQPPATDFIGYIRSTRAATA